MHEKPYKSYRMIPIKKISTLLMIILFIGSCAPKADVDIDTQVLKNLFVDTASISEKHLSDNDTYIFKNDTIYANNKKDSLYDALEDLHKHYLFIDNLNTNYETKTYAKVLLLAEWIYGNFNYQFLGPDLGMADTSKFGVKFNQTDLNTCYTIGNKNLMALWCGDRTNMFVRLVDSLFQLKTQIISIKPIHTFPTVEIGNNYYIIDPYDPSILFNSESNKVISYKELLAKTEKPKAIRTKRTFGNAGELISSKFYAVLKQQYKNHNIVNLIEQYLNDNTPHLITYIDSCSFEPFNTIKTIYPIQSPTNKFVIYPNHYNLPQEITSSRFNKYYLGKDCKNQQ